MNENEFAIFPFKIIVNKNGIISKHSNSYSNGHLLKYNEIFRVMSIELYSTYFNVKITISRFMPLNCKYANLYSNYQIH
jgi:hypothetical protein